MSTTFQEILLRFHHDNKEEEFISIFKAHCVQCEPHTQTSLSVLMKCLCRYQDLAPALKGKDEREILDKWVEKYMKGFNNRISKRSSTIGTVADSIIDDIIKSKLVGLSEIEIQQIKFAHRLSMSAENALGHLLEQYLAESLIEYGWYCCWGNSIRSVDFCHADGRLLQIKNRSNSENSSSSRVRIGTKIDKWYRVDAKTGKYQWNKLCQTIGGENLSEESFRGFVVDVMKHNPKALSVEEGNPWIKLTADQNSSS